MTNQLAALARPSTHRALPSMVAGIEGVGRWPPTLRAQHP